jgi:hypothetical protein
LNKNDIHKISYQNYYNHHGAVEMTFKYFCKGYKTMSPITVKEFDLFNKTHNGGLCHLNPKYINKTVECYGLDFSANYPTILQLEEFKIPTCEPTESILKELPQRKNIELGIYHLK